jgi:hypothetical protein
VGKISQEMVQNDIAHFIPVPSRTDGRRRRSKIFRAAAKGNQQFENIKKMSPMFFRHWGLFITDSFDIT